jgi:mannosyltransferase
MRLIGGDAMTAGTLTHSTETQGATAPRSARAAFFGAMLLALIAVGAGLRLWDVARDPLWLDEAYSAYAAGKGWAFLWQVVPRYETHPPFYYSLLRLWTLAWGDGLLALRALGLVAGLATLPVVALAARELGGLLSFDRRRMGAISICATGLVALAPLTIEMAREVRPYPLMILVYAVAILALLRLLRRTRSGGRVAGGAFILYLSCLALLLWLHNLGPLYAASLGLGALAATLRRTTTRADWLWLIGGHLLVALVWLPALLILVDQAPTWVRSTWLTFRWDVMPWRLLMLYAGPDALTGEVARGVGAPGLRLILGGPIAVAALLLAGAGVHALARGGEGRRAMAILLLAGALPVMLSVALSALVAPVFILRTMTPVAIPALLLLATGAAAARGAMRWVAGGAMLLLIANMLLVDMRTRARGAPQDWHGAVRWLGARFRTGDMVYAYPNEGALPFDFAVRDLGLAMPSRAIPTPVPSLNPPPGSWYVSGSRGVPSLDAAHLRAIAREPATRAVPTIWLLRLGPWAYDKGDVFVKMLEADGRVHVGSYRSGPIDIIGLRRETATARRAAPAGAGAAR